MEMWLLTLPSENGCGIPVVMVVVEGGPDAIQDACQSLKEGIPVVVCTGTGRAADFLTYAHKFTFKDRKYVLNVWVWVWVCAHYVCACTLCVCVCGVCVHYVCVCVHYVCVCIMCVCVCVCVRACVYACMCLCVCVMVSGWTACRISKQWCGICSTQ